MSLVPLFAGNWNNGSNAGVFNRNFNNNRTNDNNNAGFRAADYGSCLRAFDRQTGTIGMDRPASGEICGPMYSSSEVESLHA